MKESYWSPDLKFDMMTNYIEHSLCVGVYHEEEGQVGFARVITDYGTIGYLSDVFVLKSHRGKGLGKWLVSSLVEHSDLKHIRRFILATKDAHGLYEKYGFTQLNQPEIFMERTKLKI
jgi:GNAT superfamily N-acetyltransferase